MKRSVFVAYALMLSCCCFAQSNKELDSLLKTIDAGKEDSMQARNLYRVARYYIDNNPSKTLEYGERAATLTHKLKSNTQLLGDIYALMGLAHLRRNDFDKSLDDYLQCAMLYESINDKSRLFEAYMSIGKVFFWNKSFAKSNEYYDKAAVIAAKLKDSSLISGLLAQRAMIHAEQGNLDTALYYFEAGKAILEKTKDSSGLTKAISNIGIIYLMKNDPLRALGYFYTVLHTYDSAATLLDYAAIYNNIAAAEAKAGHYAKAEEAFDKSNSYAIKDNIPYIQMENYRNMSDMYARRKDYRLQSIYLEKYYHLKDSIFSIDNKNQLTQLEADYQLEKKNASLVREQAATVKNRSQRNTFIIIAVAAVLLLATSLFFYYRMQYKNRVLQQKNEQINTQKDQLHTLNQVKDRLFSVISHDLRQPLVTLKTYLSLSSNSSLPEEKKEQYRQQTQQAVNQTSDMLDNLLVWGNMQIKNSKPSISMTDLAECIDNVISDVALQSQQKKISIRKRVLITSTMSNAYILQIALRNIISNAIKYSNPDGIIEITTAQPDDKVYISVKDHGIGMDPQKIRKILFNEIESTPGTQGEKGSGMGLFLVKELLEKINGTLKIESVPGKETCFMIVLG
jgi:signal transduction histidine kinase